MLASVLFQILARIKLSRHNSVTFCISPFKQGRLNYFKKVCCYVLSFTVPFANRSVLPPLGGYGIRSAVYLTINLRTPLKYKVVPTTAQPIKIIINMILSFAAKPQFKII